jgi:hypothetical protein
MTYNIIFNFSLTPKDSDKLIYGAFYGRFVKIILIAFIVCSIPFFVMAVVKDPMFIVFTAFFIFPVLFFGPYGTWMKKYHSIIYYEDDTLLLKSTIQNSPKKYTVNLKEIAVIERENLLLPRALLFKDYDGKVKGKVNSLLLMSPEFQMLLPLIRTRNSHIKFKI